MKPAILAPLRHRPFRLLFGGQVVSDLGDWLDFLALIALIVYRWDLGPSALAALAVHERPLTDRRLLLPFVELDGDPLLECVGCGGPDLIVGSCSDRLTPR